MKRYVKEGQVVIAGYVGNVEKRTDSLVAVSVANRVNNDTTEWISVSFANPSEGYNGPNFADLATKISVGQYIVVVANERKNDEYTNYYVTAFEYGPRKKEG
jgi:hypothetical protein